jgi:hypothetical protein
MKNHPLRIAIPALLATATLAGVALHAQAQTVQPRTAVKIVRKVGIYVVLTKVKGTITAPAAVELDGFKCSDLVAYANSKETVQQGLVISSLWSRSGAVTGTWPNCAYSIVVPPGKEFSLAAYANMNADYPCDVITVQTSATGGYMSVPKGQTKTVNFKVDGVNCVVIK